MGVCNLSGKTLKSVCTPLGEVITAPCNLRGEPLVETWDNIPAGIKNTLDTAMASCAAYLAEHPGAYAFPVVTDAHQAFSRDEPAYIEHCYPDLWSRILFLGDMTQAYDAAQLSDAAAFMAGTSLNKLVAVGNHELSGYTEGSPLPQEWYAPLVAPGAVMWDGGDGLVYYSDDVVNNVRYIIMDSCTPIYKGSGVYLFTRNQLEWLASVMESAGGRDIIVGNHVMGTSFYLADDAGETTSIADSTITNASTVLFPMIRAFIARTSYTVTDDNGVQHTHDFSEAAGNFVGYFAGHYHHAGYTNKNGFIQIVSPTLGSASSKYLRGMSFFVIDKAARKVVWLVCKYDEATIATYEYSY